MKELSQKYCVVAFFEDIDVGFEFDQKNWPAHITLMGPFAFSNAQKLIDIIRAIDYKKLSVSTGDKGYLGEAANPVAVRLVNNSNLTELHEKITYSLQKNYAIFNTPEHILDGYIGHITLKNSQDIPKGKIFSVYYVSLIDMFPDGDATKRKVICNAVLV
jgi:2'-5' RNA ligase